MWNKLLLKLLNIPKQILNNRSAVKYISYEEPLLFEKITIFNAGYVQKLFWKPYLTHS